VAYEHQLQVELTSLDARRRRVPVVGYAMLRWDPGAVETTHPSSANETISRFRTPDGRMPRSGAYEGFDPRAEDGTLRIPAGTYRYRMSVIAGGRAKEVCALWSNPFVIENDSPIVMLD
jgi:hypothetical protein